MRVAIYLLTALQIADLLTSYYAGHVGAFESNQRLVWLAEKLKRLTNAKWAYLVIAKLFAVIVIQGAYWSGLLTGKYDIAVIAGACVFYAGITLNNWNVYQQIERRNAK